MNNTLEQEKTSLPTPSLILHEEDPIQNIVFAPNKGPQTDFLAASEQEVLYGGAAGGGKSFGLLADAARDLSHPHFKGLIVRRTLDELRELIEMSQDLYKKIWGEDIKWFEGRKEWSFPKKPGGKLWLSYLEQEKDVSRYQGQSFSYIGFDELTHWPTPYCWDYLRSRLRTKAPDLKLYMRATTNPGGVGHNWVKKMFIDPAPWGKAFWAQHLETGETLRYPNNPEKFGDKAGLPLFKRRFIPARVIDNPYIYDDGRYVANLLSLPEHQQKRLLEGDWDIIEGAAFPEWNRKIHVVEPFEIPYEWRRFRACDYGYSSRSGVLWFAISPENQLIVYRELYVTKVLGIDLADMILDLEQDEKIAYGVLDGSVWADRGQVGPSIAEDMILRGCRWRRADRSKGSRVDGKNQIHKRLQLDPYTQEPGIIFFSNCVNTIAQIPVLPLDPDNIEDVDTDAEDHLYDALRYGLMTRPKSRSLFDFSDEYGSLYKPADAVFGY